MPIFRTSSDTNVGADKDSQKRQREAIVGYAESAGYEIIAEYADEDVKGDIAVDQRAGFAAMMKHIAGNGVRTIIVETANRFARDLIVQETRCAFYATLASILSLPTAPMPSSMRRRRRS